MFHLSAGLLARYAIARLVWPVVSLPLLRLAAATMVWLASQHHLVTRTFFVLDDFYRGFVGSIDDLWLGLLPVFLLLHSTVEQCN